MTFLDQTTDKSNLERAARLKLQPCSRYRHL